MAESMITCEKSPPSRRSQLRKVLVSFVRVIFRLLSRIEVIGLENVPDRGAVILAVNHMSRIDPALVVVIMKRKDISALVADTYQKFLPLRWLVDLMGGIWIHRESADPHALRQALDFLAAGGLLGVAPEGTRSRTGAVIQGHTGVAYLADKANVPIIPAAVSGSERAFWELVRFRRPKLRLVFGRPFRLPPIERKNRDQMLQKNTDEVMCQIAALLPAQYWGAYRDHPRLKELISNCSHPGNEA